MLQELSQTTFGDSLIWVVPRDAPAQAKGLPLCFRRGSTHFPTPATGRRIVEQNKVIGSVMEKIQGPLGTCTYLENLNLGNRIEFLTKTVKFSALARSGFLEQKGLFHVLHLYSAHMFNWNCHLRNSSVLSCAASRGESAAQSIGLQQPHLHDWTQLPTLPARC